MTTIQQDHGTGREALSRTWPSKVCLNVLDPDPNDIWARDVCHHLSLTNRFNGGTPQPYSVLTHSMFVARLLHRRGAHSNLVKAGLLHDASEAYVQDLNGMLKKTDDLAGYRRIEARLSRAIEIRFGLPTGILDDPAVKQADRDAFDFECSFVRDSLSYVAPKPEQVREEFRRVFLELWPVSGAWGP